MEVIKGGKEKEYEKRKNRRKFLSEHYKDMYYDAAFYNEEHDTKKAVLCGVKYAVYMDIDTQTSELALLRFFADTNDITQEMATLTYAEMMQLFPVGKDYDGDRWGAKDYYSTMEYLSKVDINEMLGVKADEFLWQYYNVDIINFAVKKALVYDKIMRMNGRMGLLESFLKEVDPQHKIHTYTIHREEGYIYDNVTGKTSKIPKPRRKKPAYINIVK